MPEVSTPVEAFLSPDNAPAPTWRMADSDGRPYGIIQERADVFHTYICRSPGSETMLLGWTHIAKCDTREAAEHIIDTFFEHHGTVAGEYTVRGYRDGQLLLTEHYNDNVDAEVRRQHLARGSLSSRPDRLHLTHITTQYRNGAER